MKKLSIELTGNTTRFEPGSQLEGTARWNLDYQPDSIELRLVWNTSGRGDLDISTVDVITYEQPPLRDERTFGFTLPLEPYSFSGEMISLIWAVELIVFPSDDSTRTEIVIAPNASEIVLPKCNS